MKRDDDPYLLIQAGPFLSPGLTTSRVMWDVAVALLPIVLAAFWFFGLGGLLVLGAAVAGAVLAEWVFTPASRRRAVLADGSGVLTGLLLGLTLPPGLPLWIAFLGGVVAMGLGKQVWGGLGQNLFNPALVGRAFLQAAFPTAMTTWTPPGQGLWTIHPANLALPFMQQSADGVTAATPLGLMKFQHQSTGYMDLLLGNTAGSLGETSAVLIVLSGLYLILRRRLDWRIAAAIVATVVVFSGLLFIIDSGRFPDPIFMLFSGSLLFGAVYMATDPVTSPLTPKGAWLFGLGVGLLVVLIRVFGGLPEGVMYAILVMNAATPLLSRYTEPRVYGHGKLP